MLNLSPQQKHFLQRLRHCQLIPSLRQFADQEQFEFNFLKGLLSSGLVDAYVTLRPLVEMTAQWQLTPKGEGVSPQLPGVALAQLLLQGQTDAAQLQQTLGEAFSPEYAGLKNLRAIDWYPGEEGKQIQILSIEALEALQARQQVFRTLCEQTQGKQRSLPLMESPDLTALAEQGFVVAVKGDD
ncbi:MAG: hypothetical protein RLZZ435_1705 [Cyanobacteriota bacterium]